MSITISMGQPRQEIKKKPPDIPIVALQCNLCNRCFLKTEAFSIHLNTVHGNRSTRKRGDREPVNGQQLPEVVQSTSAGVMSNRGSNGSEARSKGSKGKKGQRGGNVKNENLKKGGGKRMSSSGTRRPSEIENNETTEEEKDMEVVEQDSKARSTTTDLAQKEKDGKEHVYTCTTCMVNFKDKDTLTAHLDAHEDEDKFQISVCTYCQKSFNSLIALRKHERIHYKFPCTICEYKFKTQIDLNEHFKVHFDQSPGYDGNRRRAATENEKNISFVYCPKESCKKSFETDRSLKLHIGKMHPELKTPPKKRKRVPKDSEKSSKKSKKASTAPVPSSKPSSSETLVKDSGPIGTSLPAVKPLLPTATPKPGPLSAAAQAFQKPVIQKPAIPVKAGPAQTQKQVPTALQTLYHQLEEQEKKRLEIASAQIKQKNPIIPQSAALLALKRQISGSGPSSASSNAPGVPETLPETPQTPLKSPTQNLNDTSTPNKVPPTTSTPNKVPPTTSTPNKVPSTTSTPNKVPPTTSNKSPNNKAPTPKKLNSGPSEKGPEPNRSEPKVNQCIRCTAIFSSFADLRAHLRDFHNVVVKAKGGKK